MAFEDTWVWNIDAEAAYENRREARRSAIRLLLAACTGSTSPSPKLTIPRQSFRRRHAGGGARATILGQAQLGEILVVARRVQGHQSVSVQQCVGSNHEIHKKALG